VYDEALLAEAAAVLTDLAEVWVAATPTERTRLAQALFAEVRVRDERIVEATLARDEYKPLFAAAIAAKVGREPPDGLEPPAATLRAGLVSRGGGNWACLVERLMTIPLRAPRDGSLRFPCSRPSSDSGRREDPVEKLRHRV